MLSSLVFIPKILILLAILFSVLIVPLGLPGNWILVALSLLTSYLFPLSPHESSVFPMILMIFFASLGEAIEWGVGFVGGKKMQVSNGAIWASVAGGLLGAIIGVPVFLIGSLLGLLLGTFLGAFLYEIFITKKLWIALRSALAVFFSRLVASFLKTAIGVGMGIYLGYRLF